MAQTFDTTTIALESGLEAGIGAVIAGMVVTYWLLLLIIGVLTTIAWWKIFTKAGKPGWSSLIPIYNIIVLLQISGLTPWLVLLILVPFLNLIAIPIIYIVLSFRLAKVFGKDMAWGIGLLLLNTIFILMLGLGKAEYVGIEY